jgi:hypothetical protein
VGLPLPKMPWYKAINDKLEGHEWWINAGLLVIAAISIYLVLRGDRLARAAWLVYLISP